VCTFSLKDVQDVFSKNLLKKDPNSEQWKEIKDVGAFDGVSLTMDHLPLYYIKYFDESKIYS